MNVTGFIKLGDKDQRSQSEVLFVLIHRNKEYFVQTLYNSAYVSFDIKVKL